MVREPSYSDEQGNLMPESELEALRAQGYTDDQILAMTSSAEGQTLASAEGHRLPEQEGQIANSYEGFSVTSDPGVRIAEAAPNDSDDQGTATEGLSPGDAPDESDKGLIWA